MNGILFSFEDSAYSDVVLKTIHCASQVPESALYFPQQRVFPEKTFRKRKHKLLS